MKKNHPETDAIRIQLERSGGQGHRDGTVRADVDGLPVLLVAEGGDPEPGGPHLDPLERHEEIRVQARMRHLDDDVDQLADVLGADVAAAHADELVTAVKLYPAGATTNSESGVTDLERIYPVLAAMAEQGLPLLVHGEVTEELVALAELLGLDRVLI